MSQSEWPAYDPSLDDEEPFVKPLSRIQRSSHLLRFVHNKLDKFAEKLLAAQGKLESKTQPIFDQMGITPEQFTTEYAATLEQQATASLATAEQNIEAFRALLNPGGFSVQAESYTDFLNRQIDKVNNKVQSLANSELHPI